MVPEKNKIECSSLWPWWRWAMTGLSMLGLTLSGYLGWHYLFGGSMVGCGGGSPCDQVLNSRWSSIGGVLPISGLAAGVYMAIFIATFFIGQATESPVRRLAWGAILILVGAAAGSAVWFIIVQKWFIGFFCPYCMTTHITSIVLATLVIWRAPMQYETNPSVATSNDPLANAEGASPAAPRRVFRRLPATGLSLIGLVLAGILAVCQVAIVPPSIYRGGESAANRNRIDPHSVPLVGSPDARDVVILFFDYKCPHCQQVHSMLEEVVQRYKGKIAFALCPAPLSIECNPFITRVVDEFADSCELVKVGLAVWVAKRDTFAAFDTWMFSPETGHLWHPRSLEAAKAKAIELVGQAKFDAALADPWIANYLQTSIQIYGETSQSGNAVPKLVLGSHWVIPEPRSVEELISILEDNLALPKP